MSRFGPIHGYGAPAILNAWQEKKEQEKQDQFLKFEEEKFDFQKQQFQAQMDEKKTMRQAKVTADSFKLIDNAIKMYDKDGMFETAQSMMSEGLKRVTTAFPEIGKIDLSGVADAKEAKEKLQEQTESKLNQAWKQYTSGDESVLPVLKQILPRAMKTGIVDKDLAKFYTDQMQSGKKEAAPLSPEGKLQHDIKQGFLTEEQAQKPKDDKAKTFEDKIKKLQSVYGLGEKEATGLILGTILVKTDPVTGQHKLVDSAIGTERDLVSKNLPQQVPQDTSQTLFQMADLVAGPISAAKAGASKISGMVGGPVASDVEQARQYVANAKNDLIRSLSINPKFPVAEIQRIEKEVNISPNIIDNPTSLRNRMIAIDSYLRRRVSEEQRSMDNPSLSAKKRQEAATYVQEIGNFIKLLGVPPKITNEDDYNALPPGPYIDPDGELRIKGE